MHLGNIQRILQIYNHFNCIKERKHQILPKYMQYFQTNWINWTLLNKLLSNWQTFEQNVWLGSLFCFYQNLLIYLWHRFNSQLNYCTIFWTLVLLSMILFTGTAFNSKPNSKSVFYIFKSYFVSSRMNWCWKIHIVFSLF